VVIVFRRHLVDAVTLNILLSRHSLGVVSLSLLDIVLIYLQIFYMFTLEFTLNCRPIYSVLTHAK